MESFIVRIAGQETFHYGFVIIQRFIASPVFVRRWSLLRDHNKNTAVPTLRRGRPFLPKTENRIYEFCFRVRIYLISFFQHFLILKGAGLYFLC